MSQQLYGAGFRGHMLLAGGWAALLLVVGLFITAVMGIRGRDIGYVAAIAWAYAGVAANQVEYPLVEVVAGAGALAVLILVAVVVLRPGTTPGNRIAQVHT